MGHEAGPRTEDRQIAATLAHQGQLVGLDRFAQLVIADLQIGRTGHDAGVLDSGDLLIAPGVERQRRCRVVAVTVNDHGEHVLQKTRKMSDGAILLSVITTRRPGPDLAGHHDFAPHDEPRRSYQCSA